MLSCGKQGGSSNTSAEKERRAVDEWMDTSITGETELLNVTMNESVVMTDSSIVFERPYSIEDRGQKISCSFTVTSGTTWKIVKTANGILLVFPDGHNQNLKPASSSRDNSTWVWSGQENGVKMIRKYTFLPNRLVMSQDCEG